MKNSVNFIQFYQYHSIFQYDFFYVCILRIDRPDIYGNSDALQPSILLDGGSERALDVEIRSTNYGGTCSGGKICVPMSECTTMYYEVAKTCYNGDRSMYCGGTQYEPYICCPKSPLERNSVCGKTLVTGQFYRGLGAFPFVARIGFKSKSSNSILFHSLNRRFIKLKSHVT